MKNRLIFFKLIILILFVKAGAQTSDTLFITPDSLAKDRFSIANYDYKIMWYFHLGDDSIWAEPEFDHTQWDTVSPWLDLEEYDVEKWTGIGWFRKVIRIDSALINKPFGIYVHHEGASEIYLNGKKVIGFGKVGNSRESEVEADPSYFPYIIDFDTSLVYTIAIRYSNQSVLEHKYVYRKFFGHIGFSFMPFDFNMYSEKSIGNNYGQFIFNWAPLGFYAAFALIFFLLYFFYSKRRENLFFALFTSGLFMFLLSVSYEYVFRNDLTVIAFLRLLQFAGISLIFIYLLLFIYHVVYNRIIRLFWVFLGAFLIFNLVSFFGSRSVFSNVIPMLVMIAVISIESIRVIIIGFRRKTEYIGIIATGIVIFLSMFFSMIALQSIVKLSLDNIIPDIIIVVMLISVPLSLAIYLAKTFGKTNSDLEDQIIHVKELSTKQIEQERKNAELQLQTERERTENERKSKELEEARQLQISMLPKELPQLPNLDIAVFMQTATEVGGDYYDFSFKKDGSLNIAIGDATGHGLKAGTMVSSMKSIFTTNSVGMAIDDFFNKANQGIKTMNLQRVMMGFTMLNIKDYSIRMINAGMPPIFVYRSAEKQVEELQLHHPPLGALADTKFSSKRINVRSCDTILVMSDGLPELQDENGTLFGYERVRRLFEEVAAKQPEDIINQLKNTGSVWINDKDPDDDVTFVVIKVK
jgi:serine phosphatase RsbU (regulator of sigma subunit)